MIIGEKSLNECVKNLTLNAAKTTCTIPYNIKLINEVIRGLNNSEYQSKNKNYKNAIKNATDSAEKAIAVLDSKPIKQLAQNISNYILNAKTNIQNYLKCINGHPVSSCSLHKRQH